MSATPELYIAKGFDRAKLIDELERIVEWFGKHEPIIYVTDGERISYRCNVTNLLVRLKFNVGSQITENRILEYLYRNSVYNPKAAKLMAWNQQGRIELSELINPNRHTR